MNAILQVLPSFHAGGVEQTTLLVANALAEQGLGSFIASAGGMLTKKLHPDVVHICLPLNTKNPYLIFSNVKKIKKIIADHHINIVHARSRAPAWSAYFAAKSMNVPFLTTYHGAYSQNFVKWFYNHVMVLGSAVIVTSGYMKNHVKKYYPNSNCIQIPSGINTKFFSSELDVPQMKALQSQWNINDHIKVVLVVGRFTHIKGHHILLEATNRSTFKNQMIVVFVGDSKNPQLVNKLKSQAASFSLKLHVHLDEKDLRPFLNLANVVVVPTIKPEAFGRVTVEAMSMGKTVIVNDLGASSEVLNNPDWVFSHNNLETLTQKIDNALSLNPKQAQEIGAANRLRASSLYDIETLIEGHIQVYKSLLKAG
jgi:glycosyltransferase involved in cell wall biosynthesis